MCRKYVVALIVIVLSGCNPLAIAERETSPKDIAASGATPIEVIEECPTTLPPKPVFVPQTEVAPDQGQFFYGSDSLWTTLPSSGVWDTLPQSEKGFTQKIYWWSEDFDISVEFKPSLTITALLLDDKNAAPQTISSSAATTGSDPSGAFMLVGMEFPTEGCWQITGAYKETKLTFNVLIKK